MDYFLKLDPFSRQPRQLLRTRQASVDRWDGKEWQQIGITSMQIDGMGGDAYYSIRPADLESWQQKLPAS